MVDKYVSSKAVIAKLYRDLGINKEINESHIIEWLAECLDIIGTFSQYKQYKKCIELTSGKAKLPQNFYKIVDIAFNNQELSWAETSLSVTYGCSGCTIPSCCTKYNFYINDSYIITDIPSTATNASGENKICLVYLGVPTDSEGYPLVPDDVYFMDACTRYITYKLDFIEYRKGNLTRDIFERSERDYLWAIGAARGSGNMPNLHKMEKLKNIWVRLIPQMNRGNIGDPEQRITH